LKNRILSLLILLAMALAAVSCSFTGTRPETTAQSAAAETEAVTETGAVTETEAATETEAVTEPDAATETGAAIDEDALPSDPLAVGDVIARLSAKGTVEIGRTDLTFNLTREEVDGLLAKFDEFDRLLAEGTDYDAFIQLYDEIYDRDFDRLKTQSDIAYVFWCCDLTDPLTEAAYLYVSELLSDLSARFNRSYETIWQSAFRDAFYDGWTEEEIAYARAIAAGSTEEMAALSSENDDLLVAFRALSDEDETFGIESARLFLQMAKNNDRMAELFGYDDYMEYAYPEIYGRDYSPADAAVFRALFVESLMPRLQTYADRLDDEEFAFMSLGLSDYMKFYRFLFGDIRENYGAVFGRYADAVGEIAPDFLSTYRTFREKKNYYFVSEKADAYEGAFTGFLHENGTPVIYFGPGYGTPDAFIHEFGHYYTATQREDGGDALSYDLAETQSQGNEFLFAFWLLNNETSYRDVAYAIAEYKEYEILTTILSALLVNDFEEYVYTHLDELTAEELDGVLIALCDEYGGYDAVKKALGYEPEIYWHYVVMEAPGYYVSYAVSAIPALELYAKAATDGFAAAVTAYDAIVHSDPEAIFLDALAAAGLGSPFDAEAMAALAAALETIGQTER